jgi:hypothetical protein
MDPIEAFWGEILSREPERVRNSFATLKPDEQSALLMHLQRMTNEDGWHLEQVVSARAALDALQDLESDNE